MQVTETSSEGLKRTLKVVVGADELGKRFDDRVDSIKGRVEIKGFRKGKVPIAHIKKLYGRSLMGEVLEETIRETSKQAVEDRNERPAMMPKIDVDQEEAYIESVMSGTADLAYEMTFEVLPQVELADFKSLKFERFVVEPSSDELDEALKTIAERNQAFEAEEGRAVETDDRVTIDFKGTIDGVAFDRGSGENLQLVIGNASFIPGFEEGLIGAKKGESRDVKATFPEDYQVADLAGKEAVFAVDVKEVEKPVPVEINDALAQSVGLENVDKLKELVGEQLKQELDGASRQKLKREVLDELEKAHQSLELPPSLITNEFDGIWKQVNDTLQRDGKTFEDEGKTEDSAREEYQKIAERRVRLGLVVGEIGDKNKIEVSQDEMRKALLEQARRFPGQEKQVYEYFEKTPGALQELRAPIFEDKVIDFILELAKPTERSVTRQELMDALDALKEDTDG